MGLALEQLQPVPLNSGSDGVIRVAGTRVTLDSVAHAFDCGATAEEIVQQYPVLSLADVYSVLGYVLRHRKEVSAYLGKRAGHRRTVRTEVEKEHESTGIRERLSARRSKRRSAHK
jgi:uncharacterized protein (DUF433 family)